MDGIDAGDAFLAALCLRRAAVERRELAARNRAEFPRLTADFDFEAEVYDRVADAIEPDRRAHP